MSNFYKYKKYKTKYLELKGKLESIHNLKKYKRKYKKYLDIHTFYHEGGAQIAYKELFNQNPLFRKNDDGTITHDDLVDLDHPVFKPHKNCIDFLVEQLTSIGYNIDLLCTTNYTNLTSIITQCIVNTEDLTTNWDTIMSKINQNNEKILQIFTEGINFIQEQIIPSGCPDYQTKISNRNDKLTIKIAFWTPSDLIDKYKFKFGQLICTVTSIVVIKYENVLSCFHKSKQSVFTGGAFRKACLAEEFQFNPAEECQLNPADLDIREIDKLRQTALTGYDEPIELNIPNPKLINYIIQHIYIIQKEIKKIQILCHEILKNIKTIYENLVRCCLIHEEITKCENEFNECIKFGNFIYMQYKITHTKSDRNNPYIWDIAYNDKNPNEYKEEDELTDKHININKLEKYKDLENLIELTKSKQPNPKSCKSFLQRYLFTD